MDKEIVPTAESRAAIDRVATDIAEETLSLTDKIKAKRKKSAASFSSSSSYASE